MSHLKEEVEELREAVTWQAEMNGISLTNCTIQTLQSSKSAVASAQGLHASSAPQLLFLRGRPDA